MDSKQLNQRKLFILNQQEKMLHAANEAKIALTPAQDRQFDDWTRELDQINAKLNPGSRSDFSSSAFVGETGKFYAMGAKNPTPLSDKVDEKYVANFWASLKDAASFNRFLISNAALGEGGTAADGSALVPIRTDPSIPPMAIQECSARSLSHVISTEMNINLPYQSAKTVAAIKAESNNSGTNAFATNVPQFATTLLQAYVVGDSVYASWELLEDSKAANQFIPFDLQRAIRVQEEALFVGTGSGNSLSGTGQPQGYLGNATTATGASITAGAAALSINPILDMVGSLNRAYYANAKWLVNRQEAIRLYKAQVAASQFQTYFTFDANGDWRLLGFPMEFSYEMPVYVASPLTDGAWQFGDFYSFAVIGDRGDSNIRVKVLDQVAALNGQTVILGYRRVDQRIILQEAVVQLNTNG
ncbi:MAG: phage major capsid protein [Candidatus Acidiferrum sp.]